jgi:trk system potassium uptake protein TrkA
MSRQFAVIGLGRLGATMIGTLTALGHEVLGIDVNQRVVQDVSEEYPDAHLIAADATDESVLRDLNVGQFDGAAVVIGENIEASILVTVNLKEIGVRLVIARAMSSIHRKVLEKLEADRIIEPEKEMGAQVARLMASPSILDYVDLGGEEALVESEVPEEWTGQSLADLQLSRKSGLAILIVKPKGGPGTIPSGDTVLNKGDLIVVGGTKKDLDRSRLLSPGRG